VSPRRNYRRRAAEAPLDSDRVRRGVEQVQVHPDGEWLVRDVPAGDKPYRCPGCDQEIPPGVGHVVAWPADGRGDLTDRRHWHRACWQARDRRAPTVRRR
jgi:hypothetical protein